MDSLDSKKAELDTFVAWYDGFSGHLTDWEINFIETIVGFRSLKVLPTDSQISKMRELRQKYPTTEI
jgi:hypothetical protein